MAFSGVRVLALAAALALSPWLALVVPLGGAGCAYAEDHAAASKEKEGKSGEGGEKKEEGEGEKKEGKGKKDKDSDISGGRFSGDPIYVHLPVLVLPMISEQGAQQTVTLLINVEVDSFSVANDIHDRRPRVMDALMRALYGKLGEGDLLDGKLVNIDRVKQQAAKAVTEITGPGKVRDVLIQGVAQRIY